MALRQLQPQTVRSKIWVKDIEKDFLPHFKHFYNSIALRTVILWHNHGSRSKICIQRLIFSLLFVIRYLLFLQSSHKRMPLPG
jgi:hypothetical protein